MQNKINNRVSNFKNKVLFNMNNGHSGYEFIIDYIKSKTYGSFRTVSKIVKITTKILLDEKLITQEEYDKIFEEIKNKSITKEPIINFNLEKFYEYYLKYEKNNALLNALFISLPFLYISNFKELSKIETFNIDTFKVKTGLILRWYNKQNDINSVLIQKYDTLWLEQFEILKKLSMNNFLFSSFFSSDKIQEYTQLNLDLHEILNEFISLKSSKLIYITEIKNALKYSKDSIFRLI